MNSAQKEDRDLDRSDDEVFTRRWKPLKPKFNRVDMMVEAPVPAERDPGHSDRRHAAASSHQPSGESVPRPIKSKLHKALSVLEYFVLTHGARKGLADRPADRRLRYLVRRLVDVAELIVQQEAASPVAASGSSRSPPARYVGHVGARS